jgi:hypothetical protein
MLQAGTSLVHGPVIQQNRRTRASTFGAPWRQLTGTVKELQAALGKSVRGGLVGAAGTGEWKGARLEEEWKPKGKHTGLSETD